MRVVSANVTKAATYITVHCSVQELGSLVNAFTFMQVHDFCRGGLISNPLFCWCHTSTINVMWWFSLVNVVVSRHSTFG